MSLWVLSLNLASDAISSQFEPMGIFDMNLKLRACSDPKRQSAEQEEAVFLFADILHSTTLLRFHKG